MRSIEEIYQELLEEFALRAGFTPEASCDLAVRLYAAAAQLQALEIQAEWVLDQSFPQTAQDVYLDYHAQMRGISRTPAVCAAGTLRFLTSAPAVSALHIPAGSVCMTADEKRFETLAEAVVEEGKLYADAPAAAVEPGKSGNVVAGAVTIMSACPVGITACTNPGPFTGGSDQETDEALRSRILESYQRLPNGANAAYYQQTAMAHTGVAAATVVGRARGIGTVDVYIAGETGVPEAELLEEVQADLQARREIAVDVQVLAPETLSVDITLAVDVGERDFQTVQNQVEAVISGYFTGRRLGKPVLLAELGALVYAVEGVENYRFTAPTADLAGGSTVLPVLGTLTVTEMEA